MVRGAQQPAVRQQTGRCREPSLASSQAPGSCSGQRRGTQKRGRTLLPINRLFTHFRKGGQLSGDPPYSLHHGAQRGGTRHSSRLQGGRDGVPELIPHPGSGYVTGGGRESHTCPTLRSRRAGTQASTHLHVPRPPPPSPITGCTGPRPYLPGPTHIPLPDTAVPPAGTHGTVSADAPGHQVRPSWQPRAPTIPQSPPPREDTSCLWETPPGRGLGHTVVQVRRASSSAPARSSRETHHADAEDGPPAPARAAAPSLWTS